MLYSYPTEEIFKDIPGDSENIIMIIPEEVCKMANFNPGDILQIELINNEIKITKHG